MRGEDGGVDETKNEWMKWCRCKAVKWRCLLNDANLKNSCWHIFFSENICFSAHVFYFACDFIRDCVQICVRTGVDILSVGVWYTALGWDQVSDEHVVSTSSAHRSCHLACILSPLTCLLNGIRWWEFPAGTCWKEEALSIPSVLQMLPLLRSHKL